MFRRQILPVVLALTRMKHSHDPVTHSHHNSVWFSHQSVGDADFWSDNGGRIAHVKVLRFEDADDVAFCETENAWLDKARRASPCCTTNAA